MSLKVNVGDLIQYRFNNGAFTSRNTRRVELVDADGYQVEGGYRVKSSDVFTVIPMHEHPDQPKTENSKLETARSADFPMEASQ
jgi:hypothetical protein